MPQIDNSEVIFIINPNSGKRKVSRIIRDIKSLDEGLAYVVTKSIKEEEDAFSRFIKEFKVFVIVGGDGTLNAAVNLIHKYPGKYLALYPNGSGNGFARELGFKRNLSSLIADINKGDSIETDMIKINTVYSINVAGIGLDSHVAHLFSKSKRRGLASYVRITAQALFNFKAFKAIIQCDDVTMKGVYQMIAIANTRQFGNNVFIAPMARPDDGYMDLILIKSMPIHRYPMFLIQLLTKGVKASKYVDHIKTNSPVTITSNFDKLHVDGEPLFITDKLNVEIEGSKVRIIRTRYNKW
jgi:diacylglycerol kinase (ATP)